jgi:GTPase SAR1 family protein
MGNCSGSKPSTPKPLTTVKIKQSTDDASSENIKIIITGDAAIGKTCMTHETVFFSWVED